MPGKAHTPEQIIHKLRQAEVEIGQGATVRKCGRRSASTDCPICLRSFRVPTRRSPRRKHRWITQEVRRYARGNGRQREPVFHEEYSGLGDKRGTYYPPVEPKWHPQQCEAARRQIRRVHYDCLAAEHAR